MHDLLISWIFSDGRLPDRLFHSFLMPILLINSFCARHRNIEKIHKGASSNSVADDVSDNPLYNNPLALLSLGPAPADCYGKPTKPSTACSYVKYLPDRTNIGLVSVKRNLHCCSTAYELTHLSTPEQITPVNHQPPTRGNTTDIYMYRTDSRELHICFSRNCFRGIVTKTYLVTRFNQAAALMLNMGAGDLMISAGRECGRYKTTFYFPDP